MLALYLKIICISLLITFKVIITEASQDDPPDEDACLPAASGLPKKEAILTAIEKRDIDEIKHLLETADTKMTYNENQNLLHILAISSGDLPVEILELALKRGFDPNAKNSFGNTPFHELVAHTQSIESVRLFLREGADPNATNNHGATPIFYANVEITPLLVEEAKINVHARDHFGYTPLDYRINQAILSSLAEHVREVMRSQMGSHFLGNNFQTRFILISLFLDNPEMVPEWRTSVQSLISAGVTVTDRNPEVTRILNILTNTDSL